MWICAIPIVFFPICWRAGPGWSWLESLLSVCIKIVELLTEAFPRDKIFPLQSWTCSREDACLSFSTSQAPAFTVSVHSQTSQELREDAQGRMWWLHCLFWILFQMQIFNLLLTQNKCSDFNKFNLTVILMAELVIHGSESNVTGA